ncbi:FtsX-like permease family protein [Pseudarthrobacter cellobiosi]|uniref:FtsX-like permease family protein n=1 Tax=Pseudarthrobacter cellobiosi TaxID=2953654 RepID=UPI00208FB17A|nr:FtsX-like permease family protein [Pseudarthrobacter sp. HLT1-5]MCO4255407.1 hypothetical protein [Pseudarthrobacter sp. HLT1-5]
MRSGSNWSVAAFGGIVYGFAIVILIAVALTIASVITGTVLAGYRDFGVAKALGCTPWQVMGLLVAQVGVPAGIGALLGLPLGILGGAYFLGESAIQLGLPAPSALNPPTDPARGCRIHAAGGGCRGHARPAGGSIECGDRHQPWPLAGPWETVPAELSDRPDGPAQALRARRRCRG